ncbi:hypothetical protein L2724_07865 [Limosilactobacillus vaginalis]|uniref:Uncharacterized protein n=1 Tax=Limosilactobacillus vaginalis TaxID=1633 RepID=A0AAW5WUG1_9LACO|nr:hypothetical protein [Limosilactobacillus vaginalis]MCZ3668186.1 hypothetical protein [Limosilactobacillus vaginalis]
MSKTKEYVENLREFHEAIIRLEDATRALNETLDRIDAQHQQDNIKDAPKRDIKTDLVAVRGMLAKQASKGYTKEIKELLKKFKAEKLSDVDPKDYRDLYYSAESLDK